MPDDENNETEGNGLGGVMHVEGPHADPEESVKPPSLVKMTPVEPNVIPHDVALKALLDALRAADTGN